MICTVHNTSASPRVFYDTRNTEVTIKPGDMRHVDIDDGTYTNLLMRQDIIVKPASFERFAPYQAPVAPVVPASSKPPLSVTGHFGIGDNLHQRAVMRELLKTNDVWLHTCHAEIYHDLIEQGLKLVMRPTRLHAQAKTIAREQHLFNFPPPPANAQRFNIGYPKVLIDQHGSILETMFACVGLKMPEKPDFSLPIKQEWRDGLHNKYKWDRKPLLVHRPIVVRREWDGRSRNPDPVVYDQLYRAVREQFFVVSVADLAQGREWIEGPTQDVDVALHAGELTFPEMAALFAEADLVFCNAGFAPVLAQAVGTPVIVVYGGRESFKTTQRVGTHLARTLPIDPINPCDCHSANHSCDKRIDVPHALAAVREFTAESAVRDTLIFGTFYIDSPDRDALTDLWKRLHLTLNDEGCDFLAVDTQPPIRKFEDWTPYDGERHHRMVFTFPDNVGHLSRAKTTPGHDGWGRAFCKGLDIACELGYRYAVHIEGDSLFRLSVAEITRWMTKEKVDCVSTEVRGLRNPALERQWIETGLMFFSVDYLKRSGFTARYNWPGRRVQPTPERWIRMYVLNDLTNKQLRLMSWKALRADKNQITKDNIEQLNLDWVTHQHDSAQQGVYQRFVEMALERKGVVQDKSGDRPALAEPQHNVQPQPKEVMPVATAKLQPVVTLPQPSLLKLNLGCGTNKLTGWENHDADCDITKPLPFADGGATHIFIEHCVEHVSYKAAIGFFKEAYRILAPGGVLRVTVPSLEQIANCDEADYHQFTTRWQQLGPNKRGAMHAIIYAHGHETIWNAQLLRDTLYFAGFDDVRLCELGKSDDPVLQGVEGHGKVIGEKFNRIESCTCEARKGNPSAGIAAGVVGLPGRDMGAEIAIIIGGAECWQADLEEAKKLLTGHRVRYFYINDHIQSFPEPGVAITLHPDKLNGHIGWLINRRKAGYPEPEQIWANRKHSAITHDTASMEWQGSSGLFAVLVAAKYQKHRKVIGCGIPMTVTDSHFLRHQQWHSAIQFRTGWVRHRVEIASCFRSMSGWTAEQFGKPDENWLKI